MSRKALSVACMMVVLAMMFLAISTSNASAAEVSRGTITSVDLDNGSFVVKVGDDELTLSINEDTTYSIKGEAAEKGNVLVAEKVVKVTHAEGVAKSVDVQE